MEIEKKVLSAKELKKELDNSQRIVKDEELDRIVKKFVALAKREKVGMTLNVFAQGEQKDQLVGNLTILNASRSQVKEGISQVMKAISFNPLELLLGDNMPEKAEPEADADAKLGFNR